MSDAFRSGQEQGLAEQKQEPNITGSPCGQLKQNCACADELAELLSELESAVKAAADQLPQLSVEQENELAQRRLGPANSLFLALRVRHAASASHALRVALCCSAWATMRQMSHEQRDYLEVAALLHDVGMIGVPDHILLKPGELDAKERLLIEQARGTGLQLLRSTFGDARLLEIVEHIGAWYDGTRKGYRLKGDQIPLEARMITLAEAFDAMTHDQVYRSALSVEQAIRELFACSGTQFDPRLVVDFVRHVAEHYLYLTTAAASRWLKSLNEHHTEPVWQSELPAPATLPAACYPLFPARMLEHMRDAALFVDASLRIIHWNPAAERLTGLSSASVLQRTWAPSLVHMCNEKGKPLEGDCPVRDAVESGLQSLRRLKIQGRGGRTVVVDGHAIPVTASDGTIVGAVFLMHDASPEASLEQRCQSLHEQATKDPLTQVANRAEFDRVHAAFIEQNRRFQVPCSLIICDLDNFKQVNDRYGHQAGDEAIKTLAKLLRKFARPGDLVARYGGEEFVMLCADCDNTTAARRAEEIRRALAATPQPMLGGKVVTASFGVTEVQPGDTPETMLRRADRALLMAKSRGKNRVVQLGVGGAYQSETEQRGWWPFFGQKSQPSVVLQQELVSPVPARIAAEKLQGFISDHCAKVVQVDQNRVTLDLLYRPTPMRRRSDRPLNFRLELEFEECEVERGRSGAVGSHTKIKVTVMPRSNRERRVRDMASHARNVLQSLRSYLMAAEPHESKQVKVLRCAKAFLAPLLLRPPR